ncbi:MAG: hypothetical protein WC595_01400 [Candidatus Nanoarchaeia archaeon]
MSTLSPLVKIEPNLFRGGINYLISTLQENETASEREIPGDGTLLLLKFSFLAHPLTREDYRILKDQNFRDEDSIGVIDQFWPHSSYSKLIEQRGRRGIGTKLLEMMTQDAASQSAQLLYVQTPSFSMQGLLAKKEFIRLSPPEERVPSFYKPLR